MPNRPRATPETAGRGREVADNRCPYCGADTTNPNFDCARVENGFWCRLGEDHCDICGGPCLRRPRHTDPPGVW